MDKKLSEETKFLLENGSLKIVGYKPDLIKTKERIEKEIGNPVKMFVQKDVNGQIEAALTL